MTRTLWDRFQNHLFVSPAGELQVDISRMNFADDFFEQMTAKISRAFSEMAELEAGAIANPDESRMVGHYWLRAPERAPTPVLRHAIESTIAKIEAFAALVHGAKLRGEKGPFKHLLVIGIGGSALGPELAATALAQATDPLTPHFLDNTDPDGIDRVLGRLNGQLGETLVVVISKSGGTKETRNGMLETQAAYTRAGLNFARHAVAITGVDSELDKRAVADHWIDRFPMWDFIGGRTSQLSAVGLLPAALQGIAIRDLLAGARATDEWTRETQVKKNPAALLALMWHYAGAGRGQRDMVILPYKDRLELFSRYLQQLVMESLGKERDRKQAVVHQGIAVYGNKGSTDQHAYVQQLRDGVNNFFVTFIEVLRDRNTASLLVDDNVTSGDYLFGFLQGTRQALHENGRESITITIPEVSPRTLGSLIALYERAVGFYGSLVDVNAYHQPGVEAGKRAATVVLTLQNQIFRVLDTRSEACTIGELAVACAAPEASELVFKILEHAAANPTHRIEKIAGSSPFSARYRRKGH